MIIHKKPNWLNASFVVILLLVVSPLFAQQLKPAPSFQLINGGYGAAALGIGGAYTAVADDLSAIYWNPAGLAQLNGLQIFGDYRFQGDSDEDFSSSVMPERFDSSQRFALSGNRFGSFGVSYSFRTKSYVFVPAFAWQRHSEFPAERELKETAGLVEFTALRSFYQSEGLFAEKTDGAEDEYTFGLAAAVSPYILVGGTWTFLNGSPESVLTGNFHETDIPNFLEGITIRSDIRLEQTTTENLSGNYLKAGLLFYPKGSISFGGYVRFPYTRTTDITIRRTGSIEGDLGDSSLNESATALSEIEIPMELSAGVAIRPRPTLMFAGSVTYSDWSDTQRIISNSSNTQIIPESSLPYPTLRALGGNQPALLQWRAGVEYLVGSLNNGILVRSGVFRDGQPYGSAEGDRVNFDGYSFGAGYVSRGFRFDGAFISEEGEIELSPIDQTTSTFTNRRWVFSVSFISL